MAQTKPNDLGEFDMEKNDELYAHIDCMNDDDLPDGAWWAMLEEGVRNYNEANGTNFDPFEGVHAYLRAKGDSIPVDNDDS